MSRRAIAVLVLMAAVGGPGSGTAAEPVVPAVPATFLPSWTEGLSWTVKTSYRELILGKEARAAQAARLELGPVYWTYRVTARKAKPPYELFRVQVKDKDKRRADVASMTFARQLFPGDATRWSLLGGAFMRGFRGQGEKFGIHVSEVGSTPCPALSGRTAIPYDFPVFPLSASVVGQASTTASVLATGPMAAPKAPGEVGRVVYPITESSGQGGLSYAMDIVQSVRLGPSPDSFCGPGALKDLKENGWPTEGLWGVELLRPFDGVSVRQLWHPSAPWPLLTVGPWYRSVLVYHTGESPGAPKTAR